MKTINQYLLLFILCTAFACKNVLDVSPQNIIQDGDVFENESAVEAYMASLYFDMPVEDFRFSAISGFNGFGSNTFLAHLSDEALNCQNDSRGNSVGDGTWLQWWGYAPVRNVNGFIQKIGVSAFTEAKKNAWLGEAKFIRAYYYFGMVKRYGGVPLITQVQHFDGSNLEELQVPRNTEKEVWDFVAKELDEAIPLLPEASTRGRANKYVALALKSRAMLYAGSIAKYGSVALNGLVGIPAAEADNYWQAAYNASKAIVDANRYDLYRRSWATDKTQNFSNLFLDEDNPEVILSKSYQIAVNAHSYDLWAIPFGVRSSAGYSSRICPTLELCEAYEYTDGSDGALKFSDGSGNPVKYSSPGDIFKNKDPRFAATYIYPFSTWRGTVIDVQAGIIDGGQTITASLYNTLHKGRHVIGLNGIGGGGEISQTGFYIRKYLNPDYTPSDINGNRSEQQYIDFRYGEILLNLAESAMELGIPGDALTAVNAVRERAGIRVLTAGELTIDKVRHERQVELAFESHRYWDIRRWRIADQLLNNRTFSVILPYFVMDDNTYIFKRGAVSTPPRTFLPRLYYERIDPGEINRNPKLVQNPNY